MEFLKWPAQASQFAPEVDRVFVALLVVSAGAVFMIAGVIFFFCIYYRRQRHPIPRPFKARTLPWELAWTFGSLFVFLVAFVWGARIYLHMYQAAPEDSYTVFAVGKQWMWKFQHPDGRREIDELHIPIKQPVRVVLISQDVIHSLYLPAFRIKHDVLPMTYTEMWFEPTLPGTFHIFCAEYCGTSHSQMIGQVTAMEPRDFQAWLEQSAGMGSAAQQGFKLIQSLGCTSCHKSESTTLAPWFAGIFGKPALLADGTSALVDAAYIRESILNPGARVVRNYQAVMPSYQGRITEEEILSITAYIQSLKEQPNE